MADSKVAIAEAKNGGFLSSLATFAGQTFVAYQQAKAPPATIVPAAPPPQASGFSLSPTVVIVAAVGAGILLLRRH